MECVAMKHIIASATIAAFLVLPSTGLAFAEPIHTNLPPRTGQPAAECGEEGATNIPGNSGSNSGSPFAEGRAGTVYAGTALEPFPLGPHNQGNGQKNDNGQASNYDVACARNNSP